MTSTPNPRAYYPTIIILDGYTTNPGDLSWAPLAAFGQLVVYDRTPPALTVDHAQDADILIANKAPVTAEDLAQLPRLKLICALATGYNNIAVEAARDRGIPVCNAVGYSSTSVAQHVFALILNHTNAVAHHSEGVHAGTWSKAADWSYHQSPLIELSDLTLGIYGFGKIGQAVSRIGLGFGMRVLAHRRKTHLPPPDGITYVDANTLLAESDVLTLHAPLTSENKAFIRTETLARMKPTVLLINTGRGGLVNEADLRMALLNNTIAGAALDVLSTEPPPTTHPLFGIPNCTITPHHAWATRASRERLIAIVADNIKAFLNGTPKNVVN